MSKEWTPETVLDLIGDPTARDILTLASTEPVSAETLAAETGVSLPTIYRRINALQEYDLLEEGVQVDGDGNHFKQFVTTLSTLEVSIEDGAFAVDLDTDLTDKFAEFWNDLETGADPGDRGFDPDPDRNPNPN